MKPAVLTFEQTPAFSIPLRFFLTAPLLGIAAAATLVYYGPVALQTRWSAATFAITHLITLGYLVLIMVGAMIQLLAVVAGSPLPYTHVIATLVHLTLVVGIVLLTAAFLGGDVLLFGLALVSLALGFAALVAGVAWSLMASRSRHPTVRGMGFATMGLVITVLLGVHLGATYSGLSAPPILPAVTDIHAGWGLLGWVTLLIMSVAYQVVPMFQATPDYPVWVVRWLVPAVFWTLVAWSVSVLWEWTVGFRGWVLWPTVSLGASVALIAVFAAVTLDRQRCRRRHRPDITLWSWRLAMVSALAAALLWTIGQVRPSMAADPRYPIALGVLVLVGFAMAVVNGMLYKIVPFLVWLHASLHLKRQGQSRLAAPKMGQVIPVASMRSQVWMQQIGFFLLLLAVWWPNPWVYPAALALGISLAMLWWNLLTATRLYRVLTHP
ncbi:MAG: hypothetical protein ACFCVA_07795 [Gammaproteobacteria bacterium]